MAYPLLFPYGTHGWGKFTCNVDGKQATHVMFLRYHLMSRSGHQNFMHLGGKLFQQLLGMSMKGWNFLDCNLFDITKQSFELSRMAD